METFKEIINQYDQLWLRTYSAKTRCRLKEKEGCFPTVGGIVFECPDIDTCPESAK